uniref:Uncharacterized protein n=1 Tax=Romanomermis culicivorax TaxID=13658 RepID=A0A915I6Z0_ROMCU
MTTRIICICISLAAYVCAETCDMDSVHQCMKNGLGSPPPKGKDGDEMKAKFEKCFTDASCKVPQPKEGDKPKVEAAHQCRKAIVDKVKSDVEKCVQKTNADFKFPVEDSKHQKHHGFEHHHFGGGKGKGKGAEAFFDKLVNESCPSADAQTNVKNCLKSLKSTASPPSKEHSGSAEKKKAFCQKKTECFGKLSATCQKQFSDTKNAVCQCTKDVVTPQAAQLEASLKACKPANEEKHAEHVRSTKKPPTPGEFFIKKFCKADCEKF